MRHPRPRPKRKPWELYTVDYFHEKVYAQKRTRRYELFFNYLRISPSYYLAAFVQDEERLAIQLGDAEHAAKVWKTWQDVGDVYSVMFKEWWLSCGINLFGVHTKRPRVEQIAYLPGSADDATLIATAQDQIAEFMPVRYEEQGRPDSVLVSIPLGQTRIKTTKELYELIVELETQHPVKTPTPRYELEKNKIQDRRLEKGYDLAFFKTVAPHTELWRAAAFAKISPKHIKLDPFIRKKNERNAEARRGLTMLASRLYNETMTIAENAATGRFPCLDPVVVPKLEPRLLRGHGMKLSYVEARERDERQRMEREAEMKS
jgi:hypothetical protein